MMIQPAIADVVAGQRLEAVRAEAVMNAVMDGAATPAQISALLVALRCRGETAEELTGFARAMAAHVTAVPTQRRPVIDTCGTGGGGAHTFNVSTAAAIVAAGAGLAVAKHGNRAVTSRCGSADVTRALGIELEQTPEHLGAGIDAFGLGFLFAPALHPAMKHAAGVRREIGVRTAFNLLGPVTNPAGATAQVIGVPEPELVNLLLTVLANLGRERALVVHGLVGVDELSLEGPTLVGELRDGWTRQRLITPADVGLTEAPLSAVAGADAAENAAIIVAVLEGERGPRRDFVVLNAAAALVVGGLADDLAAGARLAEQTLDSGAARATLDHWRAWSPPAAG